MAPRTRMWRGRRRRTSRDTRTRHRSPPVRRMARRQATPLQRAIREGLPEARRAAMAARMGQVWRCQHRIRRRTITIMRRRPIALPPTTAGLAGSTGRPMATLAGRTRRARATARDAPTARRQTTRRNAATVLRPVTRTVALCLLRRIRPAVTDRVRPTGAPTPRRTTPAAGEAALTAAVVVVVDTAVEAVDTGNPSSKHHQMGAASNGCPIFLACESRARFGNLMG